MKQVRRYSPVLSLLIILLLALCATDVNGRDERQRRRTTKLGHQAQRPEWRKTEQAAPQAALQAAPEGLNEPKVLPLDDQRELFQVRSKRAEKPAQAAKVDNAPAAKVDNKAKAPQTTKKPIQTNTPKRKTTKKRTKTNTPKRKTTKKRTKTNTPKRKTTKKPKPTKKPTTYKCLHGGKFSGQVGVVNRCNCTSDYYGGHCQFKKPHCQHGGEVVSRAVKVCVGPKKKRRCHTEHRLRCACKGEYYGPFCGKHLQCFNGGKLVGVNRTRECTDKQGQKSGSKCHNLIIKYCTCPPEFYGPRCHHKKPVCLNGGKLRKIKKTVCVAPKKKKQTTAVAAAAAAAPSKKPSKSCIARKVKKFVCICPPNFYGPLCGSVGHKPTTIHPRSTTKAHPSKRTTKPRTTRSPKPSTTQPPTQATTQPSEPPTQTTTQAPKPPTQTTTQAPEPPTQTTTQAPEPPTQATTQAPEPPTTKPTDCNPGFTMLRNDVTNEPVGCYKFVTSAEDWYTATNSCAKLDSHLVVVETAEENTAIKKYIKNIDSDTAACDDGQFFIGGQRDVDGDCPDFGVVVNNFYWKPLGGPSTRIVPGNSFTDWAPEQPDCGDGDGEKRESCMTLWPSWDGWNDYACSLKTCYICEQPLP